MAPAGDFESLRAAIDAGADSVYFGVEQLNMRARSTVNFTLGDLGDVVARFSMWEQFLYILWVIGV